MGWEEVGDDLNRFLRNVALVAGLTVVAAVVACADVLTRRHRDG